MNFLGIHIEKSEIIPFDEFVLSWRFNDSSHYLLPEEERPNLKPLGKSISSAICGKLLTFIDSDQLPSFSDKITKKSSCNANLDVATLDEVQKWLTRHLNTTCDIILSWDNDCAAITNTAFFIKHWDDLCYPSSDDVIIAPLDASWILHYFHTAEFHIGSINKP